MMVGTIGIDDIIVPSEVVAEDAITDAARPFEARPRMR